MKVTEMATLGSTAPLSKLPHAAEGVLALGVRASETRLFLSVCLSPSGWAATVHNATCWSLFLCPSFLDNSEPGVLLDPTFSVRVYCVLKNVGAPCGSSHWQLTLVAELGQDKCHFIPLLVLVLDFTGVLWVGSEISWSWKWGMVPIRLHLPCLLLYMLLPVW